MHAGTVCDNPGMAASGKVPDLPMALSGKPRWTEESLRCIDAEMSDGTETNPNILETLSRGLALLNAFGAGCPSMSISDAANVLAVSRAAARRFLITLETHGYLVRKGRAFHLTPRVLELGHSYFAAMDLPTLARPFLTDLTEATGETTGLYILHNDDVILLMGIPSRHHITAMVPPGTAYPAYLTAVGRVFLARFSDTELS